MVEFDGSVGVGVYHHINVFQVFKRLNTGLKIVRKGLTSVINKIDKITLKLLLALVDPVTGHLREHLAGP